MFLLGSDELFRGRFTDGFGQTLAGDAVTGREQPICHRLTRHGGT